MRKTNKLLVFALCAGLSISMLSGCGSEDKKEKTEKTETTQKPDSAEVDKTAATTDPVIENAASYIDLADYKKVELDKSEIDAQVQTQIDKALETYASYEKIKKGTVKSGDTVNIYYVGRMDGEAFEGGSCTEESYPSGYDLTIGSNSFIDGFEDALIGKKLGKTYDIDVTFPEEYPQNAELAGKPAVFTVTLNHKQGAEIKQKFNDEFVKKNLTQYKSVKDFKEQNRQSIIRSMALQKVCEETTVKEYPDGKVEEMKKQLKTSIESYIGQLGMTMEQYLTSQNMTEDDYDKQMEETAKNDVKNQIVYNAIAQAEGIEVTDEAYQTELQTYLTNYGAESEDALNMTFATNWGTTAKSIIYNDLLFDNVSDYLVKNVEEK